MTRENTKIIVGRFQFIKFYMKLVNLVALTPKLNQQVSLGDLHLIVHSYISDEVHIVLLISFAYV